jgi:hypothetical protein
MCYIYRQRGGENPRAQYVDRGGSEGGGGAPGGPGKGRCTILCGLGCTYVEDSTTPVQA